VRLGVVFFCAAEVALSQTESTPLRHLRDLKISDIFVPAELGYVIETHSPAPASSLASSSHPIIVHIQEAHSNYEAQKHLADILDRLVRDFGLTLILVEGGQGDVGLEYLRGYGPPDNRKEVAEKYLKSGILSGEEYLDIVSDYPLTLWGVEQDDLYQQNVQAFLRAESLRTTLGPVLARVRAAAELLKPRLTDPALSELGDKARAFEQGTLDASDYAEFLDGLARRERVSELAYPQLTRFLAVRALEGQIQQAHVQQQQTALMQRLSERLSKEQLDALIADAKGVRGKTVTQRAFYAHLNELVTSTKLSLDAYPQLALYLRYIEEGAQIKPATLAEELDQLAASLRAHLASTPESKTLQELLGQLDLAEKLLDLRLSPDEHQRFQSVNVGEMVSHWKSFLTEQLHQANLPSQSFDRLEALTTAWPTLQRFYEAAAKRDAVLVERAMAKLAETHEPLAVLITGGFHSPKITQLLKDRGVGVVVVAPKVSHETDERLYRAVLKYKSGHGSFEDVQAAVHDTQPETTQFVSQ